MSNTTRLFDNLFSYPFIFSDLYPKTTSVPKPKSNVITTDTELILEIEVPGFTEDEIDISVRDHTLTVKCNKATVQQKSANIKYQSRNRSDKLRTDFYVDSETYMLKKASVSLNNGVLYIKIPKRQTEEPIKLKISN